MAIRSRAGALARRLGLGAAAAAFALTVQAADPIRIGSFLSVTGPASFLGDPEQKTLELYVEKLNAAVNLLRSGRGQQAAQAQPPAEQAVAVDDQTSATEPPQTQ